MPLGSAIEVMRVARRCDSHIPLIVMTRHSSLEDAAELATVEVSDYISKPFDLDAILELAGTHLEEQLRTRERAGAEPA